MQTVASFTEKMDQNTDAYVPLILATEQSILYTI